MGIAFRSLPVSLNSLRSQSTVERDVTGSRDPILPLRSFWEETWLERGVVLRTEQDGSACGSDLSRLIIPFAEAGNSVDFCDVRRQDLVPICPNVVFEAALQPLLGWLSPISLACAVRRT